jgi:cytosine/adenosine deaminase-related metal-dependent hydrolase
MDPDRREPFSGWMAVGEDGRISGLGPGHPDPDLRASETLDVGGSIVAPGFISAHSHLFTSGSRGLGMDSTLYGWGEAATRYDRHADSDDIYWLTLHGSLDFLNNGITTAYDFTNGSLQVIRDTPIPHFGGDLRPPEFAQAQFKAKIDAGIRFVNSVTLDDVVGSPEDVLGRFGSLIDYARQYADHPGYLKMAISGAVQWALTPATADVEVEAMRRFGVINQPHFLETAQEVELQRSKFAWYRDAGALGPKLIFGHFIHPTDEIMIEAAHHDCGMVWQPASNGRLASGVAAIPRLRELGVRVGVGLDDQSCTDISDPFQNMRIGICLQRATNRDPAAMPVPDMLELHTIGSARVLGIEDRVGSLEVGKFADFLVVDPRSPDTGPIWDVYGTYVLACGLRNLKQVYVGGDLISDHGRIVSQDGDEVSRQLHERLGRIRDKFEPVA